jgi:AcrR family transcriptional regulator
MTVSAPDRPAVACGEPGESLRDRTRRAVRAEVSDAAMQLFTELGYEGTTVEQIAARAGMSRSSFFRYFGAKEDVVLFRLGERGAILRAALAERPAGEPVWQALRSAFDVVVRVYAEDSERALRLARMFAEVPSLQARHLERQASWQALLVPEVARRLGTDHDEADPRARAVVAAALGCLDAAAYAWVSSGGTTDFGRVLDAAMHAVAGSCGAQATQRNPGAAPASRLPTGGGAEPC